MSTEKQFQFTRINPFVLLIGFVLIIGLLFWIAKGIFKLFAMAAPVFLLAALVINYKVVLGYGRWLIGTFKRNPWFGLAAGLFTFFGFPLVAVFLLVRAITSKGLHEAIQNREGSFDEYEEVSDDFLDISEVKERKKRMDNDYNDVF